MSLRPLVHDPVDGQGAPMGVGLDGVGHPLFHLVAVHEPPWYVEPSGQAFAVILAHDDGDVVTPVEHRAGDDCVGAHDQMTMGYLLVEHENEVAVFQVVEGHAVFGLQPAHRSADFCLRRCRSSRSLQFFDDHVLVWCQEPPGRLDVLARLAHVQHGRVRARMPEPYIVRVDQRVDIHARRMRPSLRTHGRRQECEQGGAP